MYTKEYYIEQLEDLGISPESCGLVEGFESCTLDALQDILNRAEEADTVGLADLPDEAFDPADLMEYGRFSWR